MRPKKCGGCDEKFIPQRQFQKGCSIKCAIIIAKKAERQAQKRKDAKTKEALRTISQWHALTQTVFNTYIRKRDRDLPCISCQRVQATQFHAGHYRSRGAASHLRYNEDNCWKQCSQCNKDLSGNGIEYRINLVKRIGVERVEALENDNSVKKWTKEELEYLRFYYKFKTKQLEKAYGDSTKSNNATGYVDLFDGRGSDLVVADVRSLGN